MPRGVQDVDSLAGVIKLHYRGGHRDPPLLLDFHPVRLGEVAATAALNRPGLTNHAPEKEELFSNRRLPRVRVGNDGEGPPLVYCF